MFAQVALLAVYVLGALWMFVGRPAMQRRRRPPTAAAPVRHSTPEPRRAERASPPAPAPPDADDRMTVRVGVDVGGTFTKAVAFDLDANEVVARAVVPTSHEDEQGVAAGVLEAVRGVVELTGAERVDLVTHSTTQAVNALLEGDVGIVGVHRARSPPRPPQDRAADPARRRSSSRRASRCARSTRCSTSPTASIATPPRDAIDRLRHAGVDRDLRGRGVLARRRHATRSRSRTLVAEQGLPVCTSSELTGLYGLELRAVTAAINASIIPIALGTADVVERGVADVGISSPVMVMRGDGGATDLPGFRRAPARTLYSGPGRVGRGRACATPASSTASSSRSAEPRPTSPRSSAVIPRSRT